MEFGKKLKKLRTEQGMSQQQLADAIYVSRSAVAKWENGLGIPSEESREALVNYFEVPVEYFLIENPEAVIIEKNRALKRFSLSSVVGAIIIIALLWMVFAPATDEPAEEVFYIWDESRAVKLIAEVEETMVWLLEQNTIERHEAEKMITQLDRKIDGIGYGLIVGLVIGEDNWDDESRQTFPVEHHYLEPTIYHEDVEVVSAVESRRCGFLEGSDNQCGAHNAILTIRKEYKGNDPQLRDWYMEYQLQTLIHDGQWHFRFFTGNRPNNAFPPLQENN